ncbi:MAG: right-handed parallel beta-helix repeat-containing protein, partial [Candidatus Thermoplasmatota archaeon]
ITGSVYEPSGMFTLKGNLTIKAGGALKLDTVSLFIDVKYNGQYKIEVEKGGKLEVSKSTITSSNTALKYKFLVDKDGILIVEGSNIENCGYEWGYSGENAGLYILSDDVRILSSSIKNNWAGIVVYNSAPKIENNDIRNNWRGIWCAYASPTIGNNTIAYNGDKGIFVTYFSHPLLINNLIFENKEEGIYADGVSTLDWFIDGKAEVANNSISMGGNITISREGSLKLASLAYELKSPFSGAYNFLVEGKLRIYTSLITSAPLENKFKFVVRTSGTLTVHRSEIRGCGYTSGDYSDVGIYIQSKNVKIEESTISNGLVGIVADKAFLSIIDSKISETEKYDIIVIGSSSIYLLNTSFNINKIYFADDQGLIEVAWRVRVNVIWINNEPVVDCEVKVINKNEKVEDSGFTNENGEFIPKNLTEYLKGRDSETYFAPYKFIVSKSDISAEKIDNLKESVVIRFELIDTVSPTIEIKAPQNNFLTNSTIIEVSGTSSDNIGIRKVEVSLIGKDWFMANGTNRWNYTFVLTDGEYVISARAVDLGGKDARASINVTVDTFAPNLNVSLPTDNFLTNNELVIVKGKTDPNTFVYVDGIFVAPQQDGSFNTTLRIDKSGVNFITITASDAVGNSVKETRRVILDKTPPILLIKEPSKTEVKKKIINVAGSVVEPDAIVKGVIVTVGKEIVSLDQYGAFNISYQLRPGKNVIEIRAEDKAGNVKTEIRNVTLISEAPQEVLPQTFIIVAILVGGGIAALATSIILYRRTHAPPKPVHEKFYAGEEEVDVDKLIYDTKRKVSYETVYGKPAPKKVESIITAKPIEAVEVAEEAEEFPVVEEIPTPFRAAPVELPIVPEEEKPAPEPVEEERPPAGLADILGKLREEKRVEPVKEEKPVPTGLADIIGKLKEEPVKEEKPVPTSLADIIGKLKEEPVKEEKPAPTGLADIIGKLKEEPVKEEKPAP